MSTKNSKTSDTLDKFLHLELDDMIEQRARLDMDVAKAARRKWMIMPDNQVRHLLILMTIWICFELWVILDC